MRFGEEDGRRESFTRQIRVLGGDLVETVAVRQARFENTALFALKSAKRIEAAIGAGCKTRTETGETLRAGLITAPACQNSLGSRTKDRLGSSLKRSIKRGVVEQMPK